MWAFAIIQSPKPPEHIPEVPIAYHHGYNITACGIEKLHPFDSQKYGKVFHELNIQGQYIVPSKCPRSLLIAVHPFWFLLSLCYSLQIFRAIEVPIFFLPAPVLRWRVLNPMLLATHGSIIAGCAAVTNRKFGINLSGGYHHASSTSCGGFCIYADITLTIYWIRRWYPEAVKKVLIVDLDAHQGNGHERDFIKCPDTFILDFYNDEIYPGDFIAKEAIRYGDNFNFEHTDEFYLEKLEIALRHCIKVFRPDFILYNAGTDCMQGDPLGNLNISSSGIIKRDEIVFTHSIENHIPILMVLSGGYQKQNAATIAKSIKNLNSKFNIYT
ncbi:hypothetical protein SteCoe_25228 [Stentor coeruleus]|uniref:Histone deacetylase domain-containing protein n=1 Tax=Stentor coeruleus TaxID=5963 RepID=A0A1R2BFP6_9CILI|nr:hypothetical protein SteCoe_25228 [Stentor coeruleus]